MCHIGLTAAVGKSKRAEVEVDVRRARRERHSRRRRRRGCGDRRSVRCAGRLRRFRRGCLCRRRRGGGGGRRRGRAGGWRGRSGGGRGRGSGSIALLILNDRERREVPRLAHDAGVAVRDGGHPFVRHPRAVHPHAPAATMRSTLGVLFVPAPARPIPDHHQLARSQRLESKIAKLPDRGFSDRRESKFPRSHRLEPPLRVLGCGSTCPGPGAQRRMESRC